MGRLRRFVGVLFPPVLPGSRSRGRCWRPLGYVVGSGILVLGIRESQVVALGDLEPYHKDPFDRILVAHAIVERATLVSKDASLARYGVGVVW